MAWFVWVKCCHLSDRSPKLPALQSVVTDNTDWWVYKTSSVTRLQVAWMHSVRSAVWFGLKTKYITELSMLCHLNKLNGEHQKEEIASSNFIKHCHITLDVCVWGNRTFGPVILYCTLFSSLVIPPSSLFFAFLTFMSSCSTWSWYGSGEQSALTNRLYEFLINHWFLCWCLPHTPIYKTEATVTQGYWRFLSVNLKY